MQYPNFGWNTLVSSYDFWHKCNEVKPISYISTEPKDEKLELLKEIQEYYERKENQRSMPLWLSVRIEKLIKNNQ